MLIEVSKLVEMKLNQKSLAIPKWSLTEEKGSEWYPLDGGTGGVGWSSSSGWNTNWDLWSVSPSPWEEDSFLSVFLSLHWQSEGNDNECHDDSENVNLERHFVVFRERLLCQKN